MRYSKQLFAIILSDFVPVYMSSIRASDDAISVAAPIQSLSQKADVDCARFGASVVDFATLFTTHQFSNQEELVQALARFCPAVHHESVPDRELWSMYQESIPAWLFDDTKTSGYEILNLNPEPLMRSKGTGVYLINELPTNVIKYYKYCQSDLEPVDAIVNEAFFMSYIERLEIVPPIAPRFYYYSGYTDEPYIDSESSKIKVAACSPYPGGEPRIPHIRYLIMEEVGESVERIMFELPQERYAIDRALSLGIKMIRLLKQLHSLNIVHGDIHLGNFAFHYSNPRDILFLDFGRARFVGPDDIRSNPCPDGNRVQYHFLESKWEMIGCTPTFRDDVYRAVKMIGYAMWGTGLKEAYKTLIENATKDQRGYAAQEYRRIMNSADFFDLAHFDFNLVDRIQQRNRMKVKWHLHQVSELVVEERENAHAKPHYDRIIKHLEQAWHNL